MEFKDKLKEIWNKIKSFCVKIWGKVVTWVKNVKWKIVWDKVTTVLLLILFASPFLILLYIILWFLMK